MILDITPAERNELLRLVISSSQETRIEARHSQTYEYRDALHDEEDLLHGLRRKLEGLTDTGISEVA